MKADGHRACRTVKCDVWQKLAAYRTDRIIVNTYGRAPRNSVINRCPDLYIGVVTLVYRLLGIDQVDAVVKGAAGRVPNHPCLGVYRTPTLGGDKVKSA